MVCHCHRTLHETLLHYRISLRGKNVAFTESAMWPPNSPDLNLVDYAIWRALHEHVYKGRKFYTVDQLKQANVLEWCTLLQHYSASLVTASVNGDVVYSASWIRMTDTLNTCFINHCLYYYTVKSLSQTFIIIGPTCIF